MYELILGIIIFLAVLLVLIILAQNSKGGGLSSQFGGSGASNIIGVKKTGDLLEKLTWAFAIALWCLPFRPASFFPHPTRCPRMRFWTKPDSRAARACFLLCPSPIRRSLLNLQTQLTKDACPGRDQTPGLLS